jgi:hypothetical protein
MKTQFEVSINYNDLFRNESLSQIINNLEKLDAISEEVFNRINKNILEKKTKLENLKSRIHRCSSIISSFESLPQALTIKSRKFYPEKDRAVGCYKSIYYDEVHDFMLIKNPTRKQEIIINSKPYNTSQQLGKRPDGGLEDVKLTQEILNTLEPYKEITQELQINKSKSLFNKFEVDPKMQRCLSLFQYIDKTKVYGFEKDLTTDSKSESFKESALLNSFINKKPAKKDIKLQAAPESIIRNMKMPYFRQNKDVIRRNPEKKVEIDIKQNLNLQGISEFDTVETNPLDEYFASTDNGVNDVYAPQGTIYADDINEYQMPIDKLKNYNIKQQQNLKNHNEAIAHQETIRVHSQQNVSSVPQQTKPVLQTQQTQQTQQQVKAPAVTNVPTVPKVPAVPAVPKVPAVPAVPKVPAAPKLSPDKKPPQQKVEDEEKLDLKKPPPITESRGNLLDEIRGGFQLKRVGSVHIPPPNRGKRIIF